LIDLNREKSKRKDIKTQIQEQKYQELINEYHFIFFSWLERHLYQSFFVIPKIFLRELKIDFFC